MELSPPPAPAERNGRPGADDPEAPALRLEAATEPADGVAASLPQPRDGARAIDEEEAADDAEGGRTQPQHRPGEASASGLTQSDKNLKYPALEPDIITVDAVPIVSVVIDGQDAAAPQDEILALRSTGPEAPRPEVGASVTATPVLVPLSVEPAHAPEEAAPPHFWFLSFHGQTLEQYKKRRRWQAVLIGVALLILVVVCIGIGFVIGRDDADSDDRNDRHPCAKERDTLMLCLEENQAGDDLACRMCIDSALTAYMTPIQSCSADTVSADYNGTEICQEVADCAGKDYCDFVCFDYMVAYMQCLIHNVAARNATPVSGQVDPDPEGTWNISAGYSDSVCLLPCGFNVSPAPTAAPSRTTSAPSSESSGARLRR